MEEIEVKHFNPSRQLNGNTSCLFIGPRNSGKSVAMMHFLPFQCTCHTNIKTLNCLDQATLDLLQQNLQVKSIINYKPLEVPRTFTYTYGEHTLAVVEGEINVAYAATLFCTLKQTKDKDRGCWDMCTQSARALPSLSLLWEQMDFVVCLRQPEEELAQFMDNMFYRVKSLQKFRQEALLAVFQQYTKYYGMFIVEPKFGQCYWYRVELDERKLTWIRKLQRAYQRKKLKLLHETHNVAGVLCHLIGSYL
jgi:hypothetical protein